MDKLYFLTAGVPLRAGNKGYDVALSAIEMANLLKQMA